MSIGHLMTNMYIKPTGCHQYLEYSSFYPNCIKRSIVYSQSLRARRLCSLESDFLKLCLKTKSLFPKTDYPKNMTDVKMEQNKFWEKGSKNSKGSKGVLPFVVTYHPSLDCLKDNLKIFYMRLNAKAVFSPEPMVSFRSACKISSFLVRAKLYLLERFIGSRQFRS